jgi:hypothetical protein
MMGMDETTRPTSCAPSMELKEAVAIKTKGIKRDMRSPINKMNRSFNVPTKLAVDSVEILACSG